MAPKVGDDRLLRMLSRRGLADWGLSTLLLLGLGLAVGLLYLPQLNGGAELLPAPETRPHLIVGLAGLLLLFSLYALLQQRRVAALARTLLAEHVRAAALDSRLSEISALFDAAANLHLQLDLEPVLETVTHRLLPCLEADEASIMLLDETSQELHCLAVSGADGELVRESSVHLGEGIAGRVAALRVATLVHAEDMAERFPGEEKAWRGIGSALCLPLLLPDRVVGVLNLTRLEGRPRFTDDDARLLMPFAEHLAITVRRIGEFEALDRRAATFERLHALRREFLCALNHEIRNPLASVMGYAELLRARRETFGELERESFCAALLEQAGRLLENLDDLQRLYSLEASAVTFESTPGSLNQLVRDSVIALEGRAARRSMTIALDLDEALPDVWMDHGKLHAAVRHLIAGAVRAGARGATLAVVTRLQAGPTARDQVALDIRVRRDGCNDVFASELAPAAGPRGTGHTDALGWGVLLIRELVGLHGGTLVTAAGDGEIQLLLALPARPAVAIARAA